MPAKVTKSKFDFAKSLRSHAKDETDYGRDFTNLPGGITGGVAQLVEARIGVYKKGTNQGEKFLFLAGTVHEPATATKVNKTFRNGKVEVLNAQEVNVKGLQTRQTLPLCDTVRGGETITGDENVKRALNEVRKLAGDESTADLGDEGDLENLLASLMEAKPFFRFGTSDSDPTMDRPEPRTWENWYGSQGMENYQGNGFASQTTDESTEVDEGEPDEGDEGEADTPEPPFGDGLDDLVAECNNSNKKKAEAASTKLTQKALDAGCDAEEVKNADDWEAVAQMIRDQDSVDGEIDPDEGPPTVSTIYDYYPIDPRTGKASKKSIEVEVDKVSTKNGTAYVHDTKTKKPLLGLDNKPLSIKWAELITP